MLYEVAGGVKEVLPGKLLLADGQRVPFDECLWSTQASAASWLADTGLPVDAGAGCRADRSGSGGEGLARCGFKQSLRCRGPPCRCKHTCSTAKQALAALLHALQMVSCLWTSACAARAARPISLPRAT